MLKTSEKKLQSARTKNISKQLAEWATDLKQRFHDDVFFSTRVKIISFITLLSIAVGLGYTALLIYVKQVILLGMVEALTQTVATGKVEQNLFMETNAVVNGATLFVMFVIILLSILAGLVVSRLALKPVSRALQLQKKFILSVAHELRTPLAVLKTNNEVALFESHLNDATTRVLNENVEDIDHVTEILNNLLLFNRTDTDAESHTEVDLQKLLGTVQGEFTELAANKKITLFMSPLECPKVLGNAIALEQVFYNLVKNAILYSHSGGTVTFGCIAVTESDVAISVKDNGIGIHKADLPHIFEPFFRTDRGGKQARGTGLGLTLVFEIVKLHHGSIVVNSVVEKGTEFTINIPRYETQMSESHPNTEQSVRFDFSPSP